MRKRTCALVGALALFLAGCTTGTTGSAGDGRGAERAVQDEADGTADRPSADKRASGGPARATRSKPGRRGSAGSGSGRVTRPPGSRVLGGGRSSVVDGVGDPESEGSAPGWADLTGATLEGDRRSLHLTVTLTGRVPARMEAQDTLATVGVGIAPPKGGGTYVYAEGDSSGWRGYVSKQEPEELPPGSFGLDGNTLRWVVPWDDLGNPRRFRWSVNLSWTHSTLTGVAYVFDMAPDSGSEPHRRR